jgi:protein-arginine kinase activator protein McsA
MTTNNLTEFNKDSSIEKLMEYLEVLIHKKDDAVKLGSFEAAASIRDEEKRIFDILKQKNGEMN